MRLEHIISPRFTFKDKIGPILQEDFSCIHQPKFSYLQQGVAHSFLVEWGVGLSLQQLVEDQEFAAVFS